MWIGSPLSFNEKARGLLDGGGGGGGRRYLQAERRPCRKDDKL